jgi:nucleoside-diphosphate kinase
MNSLFIIKPDAVKRRLVGAILQRIESAGFEVTRLKKTTADTERVVEHYGEHIGKEFFNDLVSSMAGEGVVVGTVRYRTSPNLTIEKFRTLIGPYAERVPGTIRGDFAISERANSIHGSSHGTAASKEIALWFPQETPCY